MQNDFSCAHTHADLAKWLKLEIEDKEVHGSSPYGNSMAMAHIWYMVPYTIYGPYIV
jgi:hypothetical protein